MDADETEEKKFYEKMWTYQTLHKYCAKCKVEKFVPCKGFFCCKLREKVTIPSGKELKEYVKSELCKLFTLRRDVAKALEILQLNIDPCHRTCKEFSPLYFAIISGCWHIVQLLIDCGSDVNEMIPGFEWEDMTEERIFNRPILHFAIYIKKPMIVQQLLHSGAEVDLTDEWEERALHMASRSGYTEIVQILLAHRAKANNIVDIENSPLLLAARHYYPDIFRLLVKYGADVNESNENYMRAIHYAVHYSDEGMLKICLKDDHADVNVLTNDDETPLHLVNMHDGDILNPPIKLCCNCHVPRDVVGNCWNSIAIRVTGVLIKHGAKVNAQDGWKKTPLFSAINNNCCKHQIQILLDNGADVNATDLFGGSPLMNATDGSYSYICYEIIKQLLIYGANYSLLFTNHHLWANKKLKLTIHSFRIARQVAGFSNDEYGENTIPSVTDDKLQEIKEECTKELERLKFYNLIDNLTALQLLRANKLNLAYLLSRHKASLVYQKMSYLESYFPIYYPWLRKNWGIGRRYAPVLKKAITSLREAVKQQLPLELIEKIISHLDYDEMKTLIRIVNEAKS